MRRRTHAALLVVCATTAALAFVWSCGIDLTGSAPVPEAAAPEVTAPLEASLPPKLDADVDGDLDGGADGDAGPLACPSTGRGPRMILVASATGGSFCIDATEVTNTQYDTFLGATGGGSVDAGVPKAWPDAGPCSTQTKTFARVSLPPGQDSGAGGLPVALVSWCDAYAFCDWAGKRLCRASASASPLRDASAGEWYEACSAFGSRVYPYGNAYDASTCNTETLGASAVASHPSCEGGVAGGLFDMTGNVYEYVDSCSVARDACYSMGGDWANGVSAKCSFAIDGYTNTTDPAVGFRCCADAL